MVECLARADCLASRALRHAVLLLVTGSLTAGIWFGSEPADAGDRLSLLTAWLCLGLLVVALGIGPWSVLRRGRPVVNSLVRRDLGIWAALTGLLHLVLATSEVMQPGYFRTYIEGPPEAPLPNWMGWIGTTGIIGGYLVGVVFLILLALSNDWSLRRLGPGRWKQWQQLSSLAFGLTVAHGLVFQMIEGRTGAWLAGLAVVAMASLALRRRARQTVAARAE